ncbi:transcriptional regulator with XRE-family HTH domain [Kineothrix alysoides]|uniref:Transcriptional regulator with XRE-family HTH domain n=1 Tax=Kineothrix alysoides TaxID=1469948 RepID=A0A4R1QWM7_9FIRM|nr:helix-turn-helix transcriptional regulator [Kineothrix alysoides]TCL54800.1 transcriptional regulator with XRE-family HTH domain [Kineothrix alysoides]
MKIAIGENIRHYRKELCLTQEQLAEAMGVTVGAVSKWESGHSNPDIGMLPELADLFEISVDVLLGYQLNCRTMELAAERIYNLRISKRIQEGIAEAEKALQRYPNSFDVVYQSADLFQLTGVERNDKAALHKALELYGRACALISQNTDEAISELSLQINIGEVYVALGEIEQALGTLKKYNACGINNGLIGMLLSQSDRCEEALPYLSENLLDCVMGLFRTVIGLSGCFDSKGDAKQSIEAFLWLYGVLEGLKLPHKVSYLDKMQVILLSGCAKVAAFINDVETAEEYFRRAVTMARVFDDSQSSDNMQAYNIRNIKFYNGKPHTVGDSFGETAMSGIEKALISDERTGPIFDELWRKIENEEK